MEFLVIGLDRPGSAELRASLRTPHLEFIGPRSKNVKFGGPILSDDGRMQGSVLILEFPDRAALDAHLAQDPYFTGNLYEAVFVRETRQIVPETRPGQIAQEIERLRNSGA